MHYGKLYALYESVKKEKAELKRSNSRLANENKILLNRVNGQSIDIANKQRAIQKAKIRNIDILNAIESVKGYAAKVQEEAKEVKASFRLNCFIAAIVGLLVGASITALVL